VPDRIIGLVNVIFVCKNKCSVASSGRRGGGVEGKRKGRKAVGFKQGTCVDGKVAAMRKGLPYQVSGFFP
jgi:hypothetical protein